jgi:integrase
MKRNNGEGSIFRRKDGRWESALAYTDEAGDRQRRRFYGRTKAEVRSKLDEARRRLHDGDPVKDATVTVAAWVESWIGAALAASNRKISTRENYATLARTHLVPAPFGSIRLDRLKPSDVESLLVAKRAAGKSASTQRTIHSVLRACLEIAVRDGLLRRNPAAMVARPSPQVTEALYYTGDEVERLLAVAKDDRLFALIVFMVGTGLRRGEALALRWADVEYEEADDATARVRSTLARAAGQLVLSEPKTDKSRRTVPLPRQVAEELRLHHARQAAERLRAGSAWRDLGLVFPNEVGGFWEPRGVARRFAVLAHDAGLNGSLHTLRHTTATMLLMAGTPMRVVQELLGHSSFAITADVYAHVGASQEREAANRLETAFAW